MNVSERILNRIDRLPGTTRQYAILYFVVLAFGTALDWKNMHLADVVVLAVMSTPCVYALVVDLDSIADPDE
jgi:hypothetical protein